MELAKPYASKTSLPRKPEPFPSKETTEMDANDLQAAAEGHAIGRIRGLVPNRRKNAIYKGGKPVAIDRRELSQTGT